MIDEDPDGYEEGIHPIIQLRDYLRTFAALGTEFADFLDVAIERPEEIEDHEAFGDELNERMNFIVAAFVSMAQGMMGDEAVNEMLVIVNAQIANDQEV